MLQILLITTLVFSGCSSADSTSDSADQTSEPKTQAQKTAYVQTEAEFVDRIIALVQEGDLEKFFSEIYLFETAEVEALIMEYAGGDGLEQIPQMQEAMLKTKAGTLGKFRTPELGDWAGVSAQSVEFLDRPKLDPMTKEEVAGTIGFRRGLITAILLQNGEKYQLELPVADLNTGQWRLLKSPRLFKK